MQPKGVVVIGGHINGLGIVRSFAALNIPTAVILTKTHDLAQHSRCVSACERALDLAENPETLIEALARRASLWKGWALFPVNDESLAAVIQCRHYLESDYSIIAPSGEVGQYLLDKQRMLKVARDVGIDIPICYGPSTPSTADCPDIRFPVIVKPIASFRFSDRVGYKVLVAANLQELKQAIRRVENVGVASHVFDIVPGPDSHIYCQCLYIDANGSPAAHLMVRKIRQSPPFFGVSRVAEIAPDNASLFEASVELLRRIQFRGIAVVEYKFDPRDGTFRFMEVNGRSVLYNRLMRMAGLDVAALSWADYVEGRPQTASTTQWPGVWINLHADLFYSAFRGRRENLTFRSFIAPYIRPITEAVWDPGDPKPFLVQWGRSVHQGVKMMAGPFSDSSRSR